MADKTICLSRIFKRLRAKSRAERECRLATAADASNLALGIGGGVAASPERVAAKGKKTIRRPSIIKMLSV